MIKQLSMSCVLAMGLAVVAMPAMADKPVDESRWQQRLDPVDRGFLDTLIGKAVPTPPGDVTWLGPTLPGGADSLDDLRGRVVLLQSFSTDQRGSATLPQRVNRMFAKNESKDDLQIIALHTPEGADDAAKFFERRESPVPVLLDATGTYCDTLGVYKRPVNILVDKQGVVRYAGLDMRRGLEPAVEKLLAETYDPNAALPSTDSADDAAANDDAAEESEDIPYADWPLFTGGVGSAADLRGRRAPAFHVEKWMTDKPELDPEKVVIIDFWATWCGPCIAAIPHMNKVAEKFSDDVLVIGLSSEDESAFNRGAEKRNLSPSKFSYSLAIDPGRAMSNVAAIRGIPHVMVISSDWTVRWQGHPNRLTDDVVKQIVAANKYHNQSKSGGGKGSSSTPKGKRNRWNP